MLDKARLIFPAALLLTGIYLLAISFAAGETVWLFGVDQVPTRFGYLLGTIGTFGGVVIGIDMLFGNRPHRAPKPNQDHHQSAA